LPSESEAIEPHELAGLLDSKQRKELAQELLKLMKTKETSAN
jgi:hypothetical protein